jgi:hypothetical protein
MSQLGRTLPFNTCPLIDRFLGAIAREQTDRFRPICARLGHSKLNLCFSTAVVPPPIEL